LAQVYNGFTNLGKLNLPISQLPQKMELASKVVKIESKIIIYSVFRRFGQAKFVNGVLILSPGQFPLLPYLPQITKLASKVVKTNPKIIFSLPKI
jgi:hypothetical protein